MSTNCQKFDANKEYWIELVSELPLLLPILTCLFLKWEQVLSVVAFYYSIDYWEK